VNGTTSARLLADYLVAQFRVHGVLAFQPGRLDVALEHVRFTALDEAVRARQPGIFVPIDIGAPSEPEEVYEVPFNGASLTLWNRTPRPSGDGWRTIPDATPLWHVHASGAVIPAWNLFRNVVDAVTCADERQAFTRDRHGRFPSSSSGRQRRGVLRVPVFNDAVAALAAAAFGLHESGTPAQVLRREDLLRPALVLSHDCDLLRGNDPWTQAIRVYRALRAGRPAELRWVLENALNPRAHYYSNVTEMIDLERRLGFRSVFYMLNGTGGRFGARSGDAIVREVVRQIPSEWEVGVHYNYDTYLDRDHFDTQLNDLSHFAGARPVAGRAHYLRFDSRLSPAFLDDAGILIDESLGFPDCVGYRAGIAGAFFPLDASATRPVELLELPMAIMDSALLSECGNDAAFVVTEMLDHLGAVGGIITLLFHPGIFRNPEVPKYLGLYERLLSEARRRDMRSLLPRDIVRRVDDLRKGPGRGAARAEHPPPS
jgi:hypothetical protein